MARKTTNDKKSADIGNFKGFQLKAKLTFTEGLLGTTASDPELYENYIASKAPNKEIGDAEVKAFSAETDRSGTTVFLIDEDGNPFLYDYMIKGFMKDTCGMLRKVPNTKSSKIKAYKKEIDGLVFIAERQIPISYEGEITYCQRPLRASTAQGERIALACSEEIPAGASITITINCLTETLLDAVYEWLDYGEFRGLGQWRNSGKGRFVWEELE